MVEPTPQLDELLNEIEEDPTGIFWARQVLHGTIEVDGAEAGAT